METKRRRFTIHFYIAAALLAAAYVVLYIVMQQQPLSHSVYDSYTRQAAAWWQGSAALPENISWLEIAEFEGRFFVSFPPFPSVVQFALYPIFGMNTPDNLVNTLFGLGAFVLVYRVLMKRDLSGFVSAVIALLLVLGSNLFYLSLTGWVWFSAQVQAFFFSALAVSLILSKRRVAWAFAFLSLGIAFACRPFQIIYLPIMVYLLYNNCKGENKPARALLRCVPYLLPLAAVGVLAAAYNFTRFGSIIEFGHNYLPEFASDAQFSLAYVPGNFLEILKLPYIENGAWQWPKFNGTLFFLVNPAFVLLVVSMIRQKFGTKQLIYLVCLVAHLVLTLSHKTMGGWQFGARYLVDMLPFMLLIFTDEPKFKHRPGRAQIVPVLPLALAAVGIAINVWGAVWFYTAA